MHRRERVGDDRGLHAAVALPSGWYSVWWGFGAEYEAHFPGDSHVLAAGIWGPRAENCWRRAWRLSLRLVVFWFNVLPSASRRVRRKKPARCRHLPLTADVRTRSRAPPADAKLGAVAGPGVNNAPVCAEWWWHRDPVASCRDCVGSCRKRDEDTTPGQIKHRACIPNLTR